MAPTAASRIALAVCLVWAAGVIGYLALRRSVTLRPYLLIGICAILAVALFVRDELEVRARRAWHRIACAWMQCDEARG